MCNGNYSAKASLLRALLDSIRQKQQENRSNMYQGWKVTTMYIEKNKNDDHQEMKSSRRTESQKTGGPIRDQYWGNVTCPDKSKVRNDFYVQKET